MRYLVGFMCALALGVMPLVGCSDSEGTGGSGGSPGSGGMGGGPDTPCAVIGSGLCDDGNQCTDDICCAYASCDLAEVDGNGCVYSPVDNGTACAEGLCAAGQCEPITSLFPCTEQGIRDAIAEGGGPHFFACDGPTT